MIQLRLFPPLAAPDKPLPDKVRKQACDLVADLLIAVVKASTEKQRSREKDINWVRSKRNTSTGPPTSTFANQACPRWRQW